MVHSNIKPPSGALMCQLISGGGGAERFTVARDMIKCTRRQYIWMCSESGACSCQRKEEREEGAQCLTSGGVSSQLGGFVLQF